MTDTEGRGGRGIEQPARDLGHEFVRIKDYPEIVPVCPVHSKCSLKFTLKGGGLSPLDLASEGRRRRRGLGLEDRLEKGEPWRCIMARGWLVPETWTRRESTSQRGGFQF